MSVSCLYPCELTELDELLSASELLLETSSELLLLCNSELLLLCPASTSLDVEDCELELKLLELEDEYTTLLDELDDEYTTLLELLAEEALLVELDELLLSELDEELDDSRVPEQPRMHICTLIVPLVP